MDSNVQDWEPRVLRSNTKSPGTKPTALRPVSVAKVAKITYDDAGNEVIKLKTVSHSTAQFIIKSRTAKGLKQVDLAKQTNLDTGTIASIERGGCVYNAGQINKIAKVLGVNIPRE
jgi:ribosome-binding protein aMBF1 (putative translation factor)